MKNTSKGIPPPQLELVFDRFYHFEPEKAQFRNLFGIRLALSRELAKTLKGDLSISSEENKYISFVLKLPLGDKHFQEYEIDRSPSESEKKLPEIELPVSPPQKAASKQKQELVLVVENDRDIGNFIQYELQEEFEVVVLETAQEGWEACKRLNPSLVISDISLPDFNGFDLALKVNEGPNVEGIPIILVSNDDYDKYQLKGYKLGLHDFITKPFNPGVLKAMVNNLIWQKRRLREQFLQDFFLQKHGIKNPEGKKEKEHEDFSPEDQLFLDRVRESLKKYENSQYGVGELAKDTHYERRNLTRKIKQFFNKAPGELIKEFRMERAKELLLQKSYKVGEIAMKVGYQDTASFSKAFKEYTGISPSKYRLVD
ncbi:MAG: helix-turn-helix domain-containing protein [Bacteroidota bacterium]